MNTTTSRVPAYRAVIAEQFRFIARAIHRETLAFVAVLTVVTIGIAGEIARTGLTVDFHPSNDFIFALLGLLLPFAIWKPRDRRPDAAFWTMPVEHRTHALLRLVAGWLWIMLAVGGLLLWLLVLVAASGGELGGEQVLLIAGPFEPGELVEPSQLRPAMWDLEPWHWLVPFAGATVAYLLSSALMLATERPLHWIAGAVGTVLLVALAAGEIAFQWLREIFDVVLMYPFGLDTALTGGSDSLGTQVMLPTGESESVWRAIPEGSVWAQATLLWLAIAAFAIWLATLRMRERR